MVHRDKSVEEECAASKGQGGRDTGTGQHGDMGQGAQHAEPPGAGWCGYFSPGSHYATDRAIEAHLYDHVRNFLARRHKLPTRGSRHVSMDAVFGTLGVLRPRMCRKAGAMS